MNRCLYLTMNCMCKELKFCNLGYVGFVLYDGILEVLWRLLLGGNRARVMHVIT
jgi:hypothetical protein